MQLIEDLTLNGYMHNEFDILYFMLSTLHVDRFEIGWVSESFGSYSIKRYVIHGYHSKFLEIYSFSLTDKPEYKPSLSTSSWWYVSNICDKPIRMEQKLNCQYLFGIPNVI